MGYTEQVDEKDETATKLNRKEKVMVKEIVTKEEFDEIIAAEMANDADAGGDPITSRAYAERWANSEYEVRLPNGTGRSSPC